ncbi:hypothetical protein B0920_24865 [Massilia sp. KIM]|uniref:hypothetical protein n=1 Tax=Massilia sp. KIM TaxID=1955422 RepID=UPI00098FE5ED|nr:hypothetical protein [Massilia sp. KIM]OON59153.1 hypothetical protein B0920_24865 [Massilia sp. KIM]
MHLPSHAASTADTNTDFLRRYARRMLRDAHSPHPSKALPVVRRVHAARATAAGRVTDLYHARATLQLKHMYRTIAVELGYADWDACKRDVDRHAPEMLDRFRLDLGAFGDYEQVWFPDAPSAQAWQREHGGRVVVYGRQAVVMSM